MSNLITKSTGFKRRMAALLSVILGLASMFPHTAGIVTAVQWAASVFGVTGLVHAANAGTLKKYKLETLVSLLTAFIALAHWVPALEPLIGPAQYLATILGAAVLGKGIGTVSRK